jgi:heme/copper-type cytochrome/quinol oxidase subunit 2
MESVAGTGRRQADWTASGHSFCLCSPPPEINNAAETARSVLVVVPMLVMVVLILVVLVVLVVLILVVLVVESERSNARGGWRGPLGGRNEKAGAAQSNPANC